ncbi:hypothetical protein D6855_15435 [Butyrivibrio sp. CB08]|uniref:hypothetical protein n=1 Tax=Butyrivibrio sp. CB08 TaxID=2364879 RepID=UPI000EAA9EF3|nr:hypothetical protein [Butyrivibrio sp. CB08]RKM56020.1 hypothetical protein D6855_15435 [Butyrivibrio sp. CB08]
MGFYSKTAAKGSFNKIAVAGSAAIIGALVLCGCGQSKENVSTMTIDSEGKVSYVIFEDFSEDYYNIDELSQMAEKEIAEYNSEYISPKIALEGTELIEVEESTPIVKMALTFDSYSDFSNFNQESLFYGTVKEAREEGYTISTGLVDGKGEKLPDSYLEDHQDRHIVITNDRAHIKTPYNIEYMSNGVNLNGKKEAEVSAVTADTVQLLLSK